MPGLFCAYYLVLCGNSEKELKATVGRFIEVCRIRGLKVNAVKSKVMLLGGEEGLECEVCINGWREIERSRIRAEQMDNLKGLLGIRKMAVMWSDEGCGRED